MIAIGLSLFITKRLVGRGDDGEGFVITKWKQLIQAVAGDKADDIQR